MSIIDNLCLKCIYKLNSFSSQWGLAFALELNKLVNKFDIHILKLLECSTFLTQDDCFI